MSESLQQRVESLKAKASLIAQRYGALRQSKLAADERIAELSKTVSRLERELAERDREIERLKVSSVLVPDHRDVEATRTFLSELVREIDKCIARLSI